MVHYVGSDALEDKYFSFITKDCMTNSTDCTISACCMMISYILDFNDWDPNIEPVNGKATMKTDKILFLLLQVITQLYNFPQVGSFSQNG